MGIISLHKLLYTILELLPISNYEGKRIGIDGHAWLYQILPSFAEDIYNNKKITEHSIVFLKKIRKLQQFQIKPVVVFDGDPLLSKQITNNERREKKDKIKGEISRALATGNHLRAKMLMKQCISVTDEIIAPVIDLLRTEGIEFMIAPYEADAQLCYLEKINYIDFILTEDSDLVVFGASKILYKFNGSFVFEFRKECLPKVKDQFFSENLLDIAILGGCDYLKSIQGIGLITAHKLLFKHKTIENVVDFLSSNKEIPPDYVDEFRKARLVFLHHIVYDPITKMRTRLNDLVDVNEEELYFLGKIDHPEVIEFADGKILVKRVEARNIPSKESPNSK